MRSIVSIACASFAAFIVAYASSVTAGSAPPLTRLRYASYRIVSHSPFKKIYIMFVIAQNPALAFGVSGDSEAQVEEVVARGDIATCVKDAGYFKKSYEQSVQVTTLARIAVAQGQRLTSQEQASLDLTSALVDWYQEANGLPLYNCRTGSLAKTFD